MVYQEATPPKWLERDLSPQSPEFKSSALTTRPRCLYVPMVKVEVVVTQATRAFIKETMNKSSHFPLSEKSIRLQRKL